MAAHNRKRKESEKFNVWRSYSDMMAGLLMLFVLIMCVTLFQAQKNYVEKLAEQEERLTMQNQYDNELLEKQSELDDQAAQLAKQNEQIAEQSEKLAEQNLTLDEMQAALEAQAALLAEKTQTLEEQEVTLNAQQATLEQQQATLASQQEELDSKTQELSAKQAQIDQIIGVKAEVIEALRAEFQKENKDVTIDTETGALVLDSNIMFDYDETELSEAGQELLREALPIYCKVLLSSDYFDDVAEIIIDGYTDTDGSYSYNLQLSQARSLAVAQALLSMEEDVLSSDQMELLKEKLTVNGHSMSNPILDENGNVDMDASRRVEVKFRLRDEEMLQELSDLLQ